MQYVSISIHGTTQLWALRRIFEMGSKGKIGTLSKARVDEVNEGLKLVIRLP
jgi:hypothetical protein